MKILGVNAKKFRWKCQKGYLKTWPKIWTPVSKVLDPIVCTVYIDDIQSQFKLNLHWFCPFSLPSPPPSPSTLSHPLPLHHFPLHLSFPLLPPVPPIHRVETSCYRYISSVLY